MPEFTETVEQIQAEEASIRNLFDGEARVRDRRRDAKYMGALVEATQFVQQVQDGKRPMYHLKEAMTTSDFPLLFADILDRQLLGAYRETDPTYKLYCRLSTVPDFRNVKRFAVDGAEAVLQPVGEREEFPEAPLTETEDTYKVGKYGRRLDLSWEALVNDDLDAFRRSPERLARAARRTEQRFATTLFVDADGPKDSLYGPAFGNMVPNNPVLSIEALQKAFTLLSKQTDTEGEPILVDMATLVVPPALMVTAQNILNALQIWTHNQGGTADERLIAVNWMKGKLQLAVEPYIPHVATNGTVGDTSWFLFADPNSGRAALEFGKLRGYEDPALYQRDSDATLIGGGGTALEAFDDDSVAWKVRHVMGGGALTNTGGAKSTVASDGSGSASS